MKTIDIQKIRQLTNDIVSEIGYVEPNPTEKRCLSHALQILALFPCPTCNGSGKKLISGCWDMIHKEIPCPDCQQHSP